MGKGGTIVGTRADYYAACRGKPPEWLGSTAWDGTPETILPHLAPCTKKYYFLKNLKHLLESRDDSTMPNQGWPWPWEDSKTTDYTYMYYNGKIYIRHFDSPVVDTNYRKVYNKQVLKHFADLPSFDCDSPALGARSGYLMRG